MILVRRSPRILAFYNAKRTGGYRQDGRDGLAY